MSNTESVRKVIDSLDWETITESVNKASVIKYTSESLKLKLTGSVNFMLVNNIKELACDFWLLQWKGEIPTPKNAVKKAEGLNGNLKIFFTFMLSDNTFKDNKMTTAPKPSPGETEIKILNELLTKAIVAEKYELCAVIKNRILSIIEKDE